MAYAYFGNLCVDFQDWTAERVSDLYWNCHGMLEGLQALVKENKPNHALVH